MSRVIGTLCLSRKEGESVRIGEEVEVTVTAIDRSRVKLMISAPRDVRILRSELERHEEE